VRVDLGEIQKQEMLSLFQPESSDLHREDIEKAVDKHNRVTEKVSLYREASLV
jgi:hypothetical protein